MFGGEGERITVKLHINNRGKKITRYVYINMFSIVDKYLWFNGVRNIFIRRIKNIVIENIYSKSEGIYVNSRNSKGKKEMSK